MKLSISRDALADGLATVAAAVPRKSTLPVLANLLVEAGPHGLRLTATDLDTTVITTVPADVDTAGAVTVPARKLVEIVKSLPDDAVVRLSLPAGSDTRVSLESGRARFRLQGLPVAEFPAIPQVTFADAWGVGADAVRQLIDHVAFAASSEAARPILNGVLWELRADRISMVATNGHRLAKMDLPATGAAKADLILPTSALEHIARAFDADVEIEMVRADNRIAFRSADTLIVSRLIEGPYPNYAQVLPKGNDRAATVDRLALLAALKRMSVVASDQTRRIRLSFSRSEVKLQVQTPDVGEGQERVAIGYEGDPLEIGFNASYLMEILKHQPTEQVRLTFLTPERPVTVEPVGWSNPATYTVVLMPLRLVD